MASASAFRRRALALADEYEQLHLENIALREQLGVTTNFDQQGMASNGYTALWTYEEALDQPLLPSTPVNISYPAKPRLGQKIFRVPQTHLAAIRRDASDSCMDDSCHSGIGIVVAESSIAQDVLREVAELPTCEAQKDLEHSWELTPASRSDTLPAPSLRVTATSGRERCQSISELDDACGRIKKLRMTANSARESCQSLSELTDVASHVKRISIESVDLDDACNDSSFLPGWQKASPHLQVVYESATLDALYSSYTTKQDSFVLRPLSNLRILWDAILFACVLYELWVTPFELLFLREEAFLKTFKDISHLMTGVFFFDIIVNFNTGYIKRGEIVMKRSMIAREYMNGWFWLDLLSSIPFDLLFSKVHGTLVRGVKVGKAIRIMRAARYLRVMRSYQGQNQVLGYLRLNNLLLLFAILRPTVPVFCVILAGHIHACMWAAFSNQRLSSKLYDALWDYYQCFWRAWTCLFMGVPVGPKEGDFDGAFIFDIFVSVERICFLAVGAVGAVVYARTWLSEYMKMAAEKDSAIKYLKRHAVSMETQLQFRFGLEEKNKARMRQNHFKNLVERDQLTEELHRRICSELWASHLMSFGLITHLAAINSQISVGTDFIMELCLCIREEAFASKAVLFHFGDVPIAAYRVLAGRLAIVKVPGYLSTTPDYEPGHWLGESALVNPRLRRAMSVITKDMSELMAVPADSFQSLLSRLGMTDDFQQFITNHLWKGLCSRCGVLGDHFADTCPGIRAHRYARKDLARSATSFHDRKSTHSLANSIRLSAAVRRRSWASLKSTVSKSLNLAAFAFADDESEEIDSISGDLSKYLKEMDLVHLKDYLKELGILSLDDLLHQNQADLKEALPQDLKLSEQEWKKLSPKKIEQFLSRAARAVQQQLFDNASSEHYIFLSHAKLESGTEAALMRTELENLIQADSDSTLNDFDVPVFLDSENLTSLTDLHDLVNKSHNLVLLLSPTVLQRVWVLVELATAQKVGTRVVPVLVSKPGATFEFPKDDFYDKLRRGEALQPDDLTTLEAASVTLEEVEEALRIVFKEIAVPYSPHISYHMRRAQLECLLRRCRLK